jgi:arylsulfatase A-like enzyme
MRHPDILLLVLDAQRADRLSCYGYPLETSPHLDALAAESTRFAQAIAPAQWTIPAHASLFTGLYPTQHGMLQYDSALPAELPTLAERLRGAGYYTAAFSNNPLVGVLNNGLRRGFDRLQNYGGLLTMQPEPGGGTRMRRMAARLLGRAQGMLAHSHALRAFWFSRPMVPVWQMALRVRGNLKGDTPRSLSDAARLLIERPGLAPDQPAFVFVNLMGSHVPFDPPRWAMERYVPRSGHCVPRSGHCVPRSGHLTARLAMWRFNAQIYHRLGPLPQALEPERQALLNQLYDAEVAAQDEQVGLFLGRLRAAGALERTLLMVTADHGELLGEKQLLGHAFSAYQGLVHVPLLVRDPLGDLPRAATLATWVSTRRLFHTALAAAGVADLAEQALALQRVEGSDPEQGVVFAEAVPLHAAMRLVEGRRPGLLRALGYDQTHRAVYTGTYKLIAIGQGHSELYAVRDDPQERHDLAPAIPEQVEGMRAVLQRFLQSATGPAAGLTGPESELIEQRLRALGYL